MCLILPAYAFRIFRKEKSEENKSDEHEHKRANQYEWHKEN